MGEFDDEIVAEPVEDEPVEDESEPIEISPETSPGEEPPAEEPAEVPGEEPVADDSLAAIQDQLALEEPQIASTPETADAELESETPPSDEDLAAAVAASHEQVGTETTLDDIAPSTAGPVAAEDAEVETVARYGAPWWPFLVYLALWLVLAGVAVWQFQKFPQDVIVYETQQYTIYVFSGIALAITGVVLVLAVWLASRISPKRQRKGLFTSALITGALVILVGVLVWWGAIMALDYLRLGRVI